MWLNPQETAYWVTFTEEILNGKLRFLYSESLTIQKQSKTLSKCYENFKKKEVAKIFTSMKVVS